MADETIYGIVVLPFAFWALQKSFESVFNFRQDLRARYLDTVQLLDDISTNIEKSKEHIRNFEDELAGSPCRLEARIEADKRYFLFNVSGDVTIKVFEHDAVTRYSHLESDLFKRVKQFYDLQSVIIATYRSFETDAFRDLTPATRKIGVFVKLLGFYLESQAIGQTCTGDLQKELELIERSLLWRILLLKHKSLVKLRTRSVDAVPSMPPQSVPVPARPVAEDAIGLGSSISDKQ